MKCRSEWHSPATEVRIKTSRGPGFGRLTSSITSGVLTSCRTAAFIGVSSFVCFVCFVCFDLKTWEARSLSPCGRGKVALVATASLRCHEQFANLGDADGVHAEQMARDGALRCIFREPEWVAPRHPVIDHHARQQQPAGIAAHLVDAPALPGQRHGACDMIQQAGGTPRFG